MTDRQNVYSFIMAILTIAALGMMFRLALGDMAAELCRTVVRQHECTEEVSR
ncbi:hypothetical protein ACTTAI_19280 [Rhodobacter capsulatus]|uniref:hypothetical protein n=1 Tax=Rhodobacter capsulatus TaxID=1061 RepID=UPI004028997E